MTLKMPRVPRTFFALVEQGAISSVTFGATLAFAAFGSNMEFAVYALATSIFMVVSGYYRSAIIIPLIYHLASEERGRSLNAWFSFSLIFLVSAVVILGLCGLMAHWLAADLWSRALATSMIISIGSLPLEFERRRLVGLGAYPALLARSVTMLLGVVTGFAALYLSGWMNAISGAAVLTTAALLCYRPWQSDAAFSIQEMRMRSRGLWAATGRNITLTSLSATIFAAYNHLLPAIVAITSGPAALVAFSATRLASQPAWVLMAGLDTKERTDASRALATSGPAALRRHAWRYLALSLGLCVISGVTMLLAFWLIGSEFLARNGAGMTYVALWIGATLFVAISFPLEAINHVAGRHGFALLSRCAAAVSALAVFWVAPISDGAVRGIVAYGIGWAVSSLLNLRALR